MKNTAKLALLATCLTSALSVQAQVLSDFSSATNWSAPTLLVGDTGTLQIAGGVGGYYTNGAPTDTQFAYMGYTGVTLSYDTSWSIRVDVNYAAPDSYPDGAFTSGSQQFINLGLLVTPSTATVGFAGAPTFDGFSVESSLFSTTTDTYNRDFRSVLWSNGASADGAALGYSTVTGATSTAVILSYNAATKLLTAGFDGNTANGYHNFSLPAQTVNVNTAWGMNTSSTFSLYLYGASGWDEAGIEASPRIGLGQATFDNLTAIPEPSTYAALAGALGLGFAAWRRRKAAV